jgi:hypothetical protein
MSINLKFLTNFRLTQKVKYKTEFQLENCESKCAWEIIAMDKKSIL